MEKIINIKIERLSGGYYLATSENIQGLVVQGRTVAETIEITRDVAKKLLEAKEHEKVKDSLLSISDKFNYPIIIGL